MLEVNGFWFYGLSVQQILSFKKLKSIIKNSIIVDGDK